MAKRLFKAIVIAAVEGLAGSLQADVLQLEKGNYEIVVASDACGTTRFAAEELRDLSGAMLGGEAPIVDVPSGAKVALILGTNAWSEAAGIRGASLERDMFRIRADGASRRIYIAGRDAGDQGEIVRLGRYGRARREMATLYGVYAFLERYGGARFYFPGAYGTILPKREQWVIPADTDEEIKPAFLVRNIYFNGDGAWYDGSGVKTVASASVEATSQAKALNYVRLRLESFNIPSCHGQMGFDYQKRFAETHPEYFALLPDPQDGGRLRRDTDPQRKLEYHPYQLCHSSHVWDEFYEDILAHSRGERASSRGLEKWGSNFSGRYIDIMPMDGMPACRCEACQRAYAGSTDKRSFATALVWGQVSNMVSRLNAKGIDATYTMMAYSCYAGVPNFALPSNILIQVAVGGPWNQHIGDRMAQDKAKVRAWAEKVNAKVRVWTYPGKYARYQAPCVPQMTPHAYAAFWQDLAPWVTGGFVESESDFAIYNYLNYYVFSRIAWDPKVDVEAILDEHYRLMFGKAAPEMKRFYEALEEKWLKEVCIVAEQSGTAKDPHRRVPDALKMANTVYSKRVLSEWVELFKRAIAAVQDDAESLKRVRFIRHVFLLPMARHFAEYTASLDVNEGLAKWRAANVRTNLVEASKFAFSPTCAGPTRDAAQTVTGEPSFRVSSRDGKGWPSAYFDFAANGVKLKPNTKYRISYFLKYENVVPNDSDAGVAVNIDYKFRYGWMNPNIPFTGSHDWMCQTFVIDTAAYSTHRSRLRLQLIGASGTAWFDGVRMEELPSQ